MRLQRTTSGGWAMAAALLLSLPNKLCYKVPCCFYTSINLKIRPWCSMRLDPIWKNEAKDLYICAWIGLLDQGQRGGFFSLFSSLDWKFGKNSNHFKPHGWNDIGWAWNSLWINSSIVWIDNLFALQNQPCSSDWSPIEEENDKWYASTKGYKKRETQLLCKRRWELGAWRRGRRCFYTVIFNFCHFTAR